MAPSPKQYLACSLLAKTSIDAAVFRLDFGWPGPAPGAGQFFMVRALRGGSFLGRPLSVYRRDHGLSFLVQKKGRGTMELSQLGPGEQAALSSP
jgi:NAD(P)H-flavin reductase